MLNLGLFSSLAAARALSQPQPAAPEGDAGPTHKKNLKIIALALLIEAGVSGGIFYGAWENAQIFAASNPVFMLLAPFLCVVLEFTKVSVGVCSQTHPSAAKRALAAFVLWLAATSTAINAVPIFAKLWKPQLAVVRQDAENVAVAEANKATFDKKIQAAKDAKAAAEGVYKEAQSSRRTASKRDARAKGTNSDLSDARKDVSDAKKKFDDASAALAKLNPKPTDDAVRDGESALRAARQASTLHWIYGAATGAEVSSVSDKQLAPLMIGAVGLPSALVAAISSLLSILAVSATARPAPAKEKPAPELVEVPDELPLAIMTAAANKIAEAAASRVSEKIIGDMERAAKPAANDNEKTPLETTFRRFIAKAKGMAKRPRKAKASRKTEPARKGNGSVEPVAAKRRGRPPKADNAEPAN
jgi:hypothetical protein